MSGATLPYSASEALPRGSTGSECLPPCGVGYAVIALSKTVDVGRDHLIHRGAVPLPLEGKDNARSKLGRDCKCRARHFHLAASEALPDRGRVRPVTSADGAKPIAGRGGLEGVTPPHKFKARTAASDGQHASTRAARSAGLRFAVRSLSKAIGREISKVRRPGWHLIHRCRGPPSPRRGRTMRPLRESILP